MGGEDEGPVRIPGAFDSRGYDLDMALRSVGPGWRRLVERVFDAKPDEVDIVQVKEKFAGLRVYTSLQPVRVDAIGVGSFEVPNSRPSGMDDLEETQRDRVLEYEALLRRMESESFSVCEQCGASGRRRPHPWLLTLCDECDRAMHAGNTWLEGVGGPECGGPDHPKDAGPLLMR